MYCESRTKPRGIPFKQHPMNSSNKVTTRLGQLFTRKIDLIWFAATARVKVQNGRKLK